jgi:hypothetical protein
MENGFEITTLWFTLSALVTGSVHIPGANATEKEVGMTRLLFRTISGVAMDCNTFT